MAAQPTIGILALQGGFDLHSRALAELGHQVILVRKPEQLSQLKGLIIPGGESSSLLKLAEPLGMLPMITKFAAEGGSIFGTCAGAILLAQEVTNPQQVNLSLIDMTIERNGYGRQLNSQEAVAQADKAITDSTLPVTFIRAPRIIKIGPNVEVLARYQNDPVLVRSGRVLAATFHPELTDDRSVYRYWLDMISV